MWKRDDWAHLFQRNDTSMPAWWQDPRHVALQYQLARMCPAAFTNVLEVGCFQGASTSAYIQAQREGAALELTCCDIKITDELRATVARSPRPVQLLEMESLLAIKPDYDVVCLDGMHTLEVVTREVGLCLAYETPTLIMHDTCFVPMDGFEGPRWARLALEASMLYLCATDGLAREGEYTDRGLTVATRIPEVYRAAKQLMGQL